MKELDLRLNALVDFPDDCWAEPFDYQALRSLLEKLTEYRIDRLYWYWYGDRRDKWFWDHHNPQKEAGRLPGCVQTALNMPDFNHFAAKTARELGMTTVAVMRLLENGNAATYSEFYPEVQQYASSQGLPVKGGYLLDGCDYVYKHPEDRIKRRIFDIDEEAEKMPVCAIELRKQNGRSTRIRKENLTIYVSENNCHYKKYEGDFQFHLTTAVAEDDVVVISQSNGWHSKGYGRKTLTHKGDMVTAIRLDGFTIYEPYIAVVCQAEAPYDEEDQDLLFTNTLMQGIRCYATDGRLIPSAVGNEPKVWADPVGRDWRESGLGFDMGFGEYFEYTLDPVIGEGVYGIARGKSRYVHSTLCECCEGVQAYWMDLLNRCITDGFDYISHRIENHSLMMDEPFAYGYNDSIKKLYWNRYGKCEEKEMSLDRIAKIRGDVYSSLFIKGAQIARSAGMKIDVQLNTEMLHDPIPMERRFAYPMNIEWQWERWLDAIKPDAITLRTFRFSPEFVLRDPQCRHLIETARSFNVPITYERYVTAGDFISEYKLIRDSGLFDSMTIYETASVFRHKGNGTFEELLPDLMKQLKTIR